jgi:Fur family ferric uptake transcriptional regulator
VTSPTPSRPAPSPPLIEALDRAGVRVTEPRRAVARLVAEQRGHFTANDLVDEAARRHLAVGRATVFRSLDLFADLNLVERLDLPDGVHAYVACEPKHHHHVVCRSCGRSTDVEDSGITEVVARIADRTGFTVTEHRLELFGLCPSCAARGTR